MRITSTLKNRPVNVLIDSGSTHNFIHPSLAKQCRLSSHKDKNFKVMVADDNFITSLGTCSGVSLYLQEYPFDADFFLLAISGCDVVLGAQWFRSLGVISWDFSQLIMTFTVADYTYTLVGDNSPTIMFLGSEKPSIGYLGHIISGNGVAVDDEKTASVIRWPIPSSLKDLCEFLGLTGYYQKIVKDYGKISAPLTQLLKNEAFRWTEEATTALANLKTALTTTLVLALPNFSTTFTIERKNLNLSVYDKEMLAIVSAQQKWLSKLLGFDYEILYRSGSSNQAVDALSRFHDSGSLLAFSSPTFAGIDAICIACHNDPATKAIIEGIQ
ncbi:hypothetical protein HHK36_020371 [Tetracentron sinense]|uniref:Uncharacterized protein n=1 Tax=Tetracentron sinense TaxID=13715 RepID=A0A834YV14_TETSI|nr:hypothetical protein HHK36_020371 [Tetracentron sinense]